MSQGTTIRINSSSVDLYAAIVENCPPSMYIEGSPSPLISLWENFKDKALPMILSFARHASSKPSVSADLGFLGISTSYEASSNIAQFTEAGDDEIFNEFYNCLVSIASRIRVFRTEESSSTLLQEVYMQTLIKKSNNLFQSCIDGKRHRPGSFSNSFIFWVLITKLISRAMTFFTKRSEFADGMHIIVPAGALIQKYFY